MAAKAKKGNVLELDDFVTETSRFHLIGTTPMIIRRMSQKAQQELLNPRGRKTAAQKAKSIKHPVIEEFLESPYTDPNPKGPTYIQQMGSCFKMAMCGAAVDVAGASKAQTKRLVIVDAHRVAIYGKPMVHMSIVRSADMNKTPDVRTRCIVVDWAAEVDITYSTPMTAKSVAQLLSIAGITQGIGDWRPEKGSGNFGQFKIVGDHDKEFLARKKFGRKEQITMMDKMECYDDETQELFDWWFEDMKDRGIEVKRETNLKLIA